MDHGILTTGNIFADKTDDLPELFSALFFSVGQFRTDRRIFHNHSGGIQVNDIIRRSIEPQQVFPGTIQISGGFDFSVNPVDLFARRHFCPVNIAEFETEGHRLAESLIIAKLKRTTGLRRHIAVTGTVDHHFGIDRTKTGFGVKDNAPDRFIFHDHIEKGVVIERFHAGILQKFFSGKHGNLFGKRCILYHIAGKFLFRQSFKFPHLKVPVGIKRSIQSYVVDMVGHKWGNFPQIRHPAGGIAAFNEHYFNALTRRHYCRRKSTGTAADDQHIGFADHRDIPVNRIVYCHIFLPIDKSQVNCLIINIPFSPLKCNDINDYFFVNSDCNFVY